MSKHYPVSRLQLALQMKEKMPLHRAALTALRTTVNASEALLDALDLWIDGKLPEDYAMGSYTVAKVMARYKVQPFEALLMMEAFVSHPEEAGQLLWAQRFDRVVLNVERIADEINADNEEKGEEDEDDEDGESEE